MIPLLGCSLLSMTVILERLYFWLRISSLANRNQLDMVLGSIHRNQIPQAESRSPGKMDPHASILLEALEEKEQDLSAAIRLKTLHKIEEMHKGMMILNTIITLAPLLGILGTVVGIIDSFHAIGSDGNPAPQAVSQGIAKALITTAGGLGVAILTLVPYNYFHARMNRFTGEMERISARFCPTDLKGWSHAA